MAGEFGLPRRTRKASVPPTNRPAITIWSDTFEPFSCPCGAEGLAGMTPESLMGFCSCGREWRIREYTELAPFGVIVVLVHPIPASEGAHGRLEASRPVTVGRMAIVDALAPRDKRNPIAPGIH